MTRGRRGAHDRPHRRRDGGDGRRAPSAALTVYDMVKGIEPGVVIERVELLDKTGGKSDFHRRSWREAAGRRPRTPDRGRAHLGHRPLQLPLPVLHARRGPAVAEPRRAAHATRRSSASCALLASMGVHDVRLTGGEPLVRKELWRLVEQLSAIEDVHDLSLTTNGYLLARQVDDLVRAGLRRVNVSLDALAPDRFFQLTRRDSLQQVLEGLAAAAAPPGAAADQGQRRRAQGLHRGRGAALRRVRPPATRTRSASSSSCRSTPTATWTRDKVLAERGDRAS